MYPHQYDVMVLIEWQIHSRNPFKPILTEIQFVFEMTVTKKRIYSHEHVTGHTFRLFITRYHSLCIDRL